MPIEELQEPIWEKQKGETPNQYCYFLEFLEYKPNDIKGFHQHLCERDQEGLLRTKLPAYKTLRNWSGPACNKWIERKTAKRAAEKKDIIETLHELDKEDIVEEYQIKKRINKKLLDRIEREIDYQPMSQINQGITGFKTLKDDNRVDKGEATEFTNTQINADIDATVEAQTKLETDFQTAYQDLIDTTNKNSLHIDDDS